MSENEKLKKLLWVDDDPPRRFRYEQRVALGLGFQVQFAHDVSDAGQLLSDCIYNALILDQTMPYERGNKFPESIWAGCVLLRWLRGKEIPSQVPNDNGLKKLLGLQPMEVNSNLKVLIVSAFYDKEVEEETRKTSRLDTCLEIAPKPLDTGILRKYLRSIRKKNRNKDHA